MKQMVKAIKGNQKRQFTKMCWDLLGTNKEGWIKEREPAPMPPEAKQPEQATLHVNDTSTNTHNLKIANSNEDFKEVANAAAEIGVPGIAKITQVVTSKPIAKRTVTRKATKRK